MQCRQRVRLRDVAIAIGVVGCGLRGLWVARILQNGLRVHSGRRAKCTARLGSERAFLLLLLLQGAVVVIAIAATVIGFSGGYPLCGWRLGRGRQLGRRLQLRLKILGGDPRSLFWKTFQGITEDIVAIFVSDFRLCHKASSTMTYEYLETHQADIQLIPRRVRKGPFGSG